MMKIYAILMILLLAACSQQAEEQEPPEEILPPQETEEPEAPAETCIDGIKNQDEEDVDCGGVCPICAPKETCSDGLKNQNEEGVDCGGVCKPCQMEGYEINSDDLSKLEDKLTQGTRATLLTTSYPAGIDIGDSYVFALGITNTLQETKLFRVSLKFKDAVDMKSNPIDGQDTITGNYYFGVVVEYQETSRRWEEHAIIPFSFRVK